MLSKLIILSEVIFILGLIIGYFKYGWTKSISALYDKLKEDPKGKGWWFTAWQIAFVLPLIFIAIFATIQGYLIWQGILLGMACTFIIFSAIAGDTEEHKIVKKIHTIGAFGGIVLGAMFITSTNMWGLIIAILGCISTYYMMKKKVKNHTYIIEVKWYHLIQLVLLAITSGILCTNLI